MVLLLSFYRFIYRWYLIEFYIFFVLFHAHFPLVLFVPMHKQVSSTMDKRCEINIWLFKLAVKKEEKKQTKTEKKFTTFMLVMFSKLFSVLLYIYLLTVITPFDEFLIETIGSFNHTIHLSLSFILQNVHN